LGALARIVELDLEIVEGDPPAEYVSHLAAVLDSTLVRSQKLLRARAGDEGSKIGRGKSIIESLPAVKKFVNGDTRRPKPTHFCNGCCVGASGSSERNVSVRNFISALSATPIFGGVHSGKPAKSRWFSTTFFMSMVLAGMLIHDLFPRSWRLAFSQWQLPRGLALDDYSKMVRSKAYRGKLWLSSDCVDIKTSLHCFGANPGEHLMMVLQKLDASGGVLFKVTVHNNSNPVAKCLQEYADMLLRPSTTLIALLFYQFENDECDNFALFMLTLRIVVLTLSSKIWRFVLCKYLSWPYRLVQLVSPDPAVRTATADALYAANECCLDRGMSQKARTLSANAVLILMNIELLCALKCWALIAVVGNMLAERLLSAFKRCAALRCFAERSMGASFLTQVLTSHLQAGGDDIRKITRAALRSLGVPIRAKARGRSAKEKTQKRPQQRFSRWANRQMKGLRGTRENYRSRMAELKDQWKQSGPFYEASDADDGDGVDDIPSYADKIGTSLMGISSQETPVCFDLVEAEVQRAAPTRSNAPPGMTRRLQDVRQEYLNSCYIKDTNAIRENETFSANYSCGKLHPGLCKEDCNPEIDDAYVSFRDGIKSWPIGTFFAIEVRAEGFPISESSYYCLCWPADVILCECDVDGEGAPLFRENPRAADLPSELEDGLSEQGKNARQKAKEEAVGGLVHVVGKTEVQKLWISARARIESMKAVRFAEDDFALVNTKEPRVLPSRVNSVLETCAIWPPTVGIVSGSSGGAAATHGAECFRPCPKENLKKSSYILLSAAFLISKHINNI
jgi:hypothetical protein